MGEKGERRIDRGEAEEEDGGENGRRVAHRVVSRALAREAPRALEGNLGSFAEGCILIPGASAAARSLRATGVRAHAFTIIRTP